QDINGEGRIERASIMTPTAQNIANLEADMRQLAEKMVAGGYDADLITLEVEKLVRAYDPCLSCSVH
ncbi:MAG: Ni/Fe hydrogenase subunit alpha, partial [Adlercreutzia sp.]